MKTIVLDTGYWIALFNPKKEIEKQEVVKFVTNIIDENEHEVLIPFPTLYEFLNSKLSRKKININFNVELSKGKYTKIDDKKYRDKALINFSNQFVDNISDISLVDEVIKLMITDDKLRVDYIVTFDKSLKDFAKSYNVEVINDF